MGVLYDYQIDAVNKMKNGCILCGSVGSGKSRTAIGYYLKTQGADDFDADSYTKAPYKPCDLYIITTARKRDTEEWYGDLSPFSLFPNKYGNDLYLNSVEVDSWNNIKKYTEVEDAFFIFDEQRVVGHGEWVKSFLKIAKNNRWILLSATPGDSWSDYIPVFIANGFYKNRTEFNREHIVFSRFAKYPKVDHYINEGMLLRHRNDILIDMDFEKKTERHEEQVVCDYPMDIYKKTMKTRWNPYTNEPIQQASGLCYVLRRIVNESESRQAALLDILDNHDRAIIFYNFDYELEILRNLCYRKRTVVAEWNGHKHDDIPTSKLWVYLVQYTAGCEGWNCIYTDTMIFYSQNYSYKTMQQAKGRIDRLNTPFKHLYYYHLRSQSTIDLAIRRSLAAKKQFNEKQWIGNW